MIDRQSKDNNESQKQIDEFLAKGGKITQCPPGARTEDINFKGSFFGKRNKKAEEGKE